VVVVVVVVVEQLKLSCQHSKTNKMWLLVPSSAYSPYTVDNAFGGQNAHKSVALFQNKKAECEMRLAPYAQ